MNNYLQGDIIVSDNFQQMFFKGLIHEKYFFWFNCINYDYWV